MLNVESLIKKYVTKWERILSCEDIQEHRPEFKE